MMIYLDLFLTSFFVAIMLTPLIRKLALKHNIVDHPGVRKIHQKLIPRLGGLAIFGGFVFALLLISQLHGLVLDNNIFTVLLGGLAVVLLGLIDDIIGLKAPVKLFFEILIAVVVVWAGVKISFIYNPFTLKIINIGFIGSFLSVALILVLMNTINLIDGLDGLASGVTVISALSLFIISLFLGQHYSAILLIALAGATVGFLKYNFNPASIFMGDSGSLFLGYILATASILGVLKSSLVISLSIPILSLLLPIGDTVFAIVRRVKNKRHIFRADNEHIHHKLLFKGYSQRDAVIVLYWTAALLNLMAILISLTNGFWSLFLMGIVVLIIVRGFNKIKKYLRD